jgi:hypothetical protein
MRQLRGGGTLSPEVAARLTAGVAAHPDRAAVWEDANVTHAVLGVDGWRLSVARGSEAREAHELHADLVLLATGCAVDVRSHPLMREFVPLLPASDTLAGGLPALDAELRWAPGVNVHVCGAWAAHQLGPDALNLAGGVAAARRLWPLLRPRLEEAALAASTSHGASKLAASTERRNPTLTKGAAATLDRLLGGDGNLFAALADDSDSDSDSEAGDACAGIDDAEHASVGDVPASGAADGLVSDSLSQADTCTCADTACCGGAGDGGAAAWKEGDDDFAAAAAGV